MVKKPQANTIIEKVHVVINDMLRTNDLDNHTFHPVNPRGDIIDNIAWAIRSLTHSTLNATPGQLVFNQDMLFDLNPFRTDFSRSDICVASANFLSSCHLLLALRQ